METERPFSECQRASKGFSLLEALTVVFITTVMSTVALIQMKSTIADLDADKASNLVVSQLNYGRQIAVNERRNVQVQFVGTNEIQVIRQDRQGTNQGAWNSALTYNANDFVTDSGQNWLAVTANTNSRPSISNSNWQLLATVMADVTLPSGYVFGLPSGGVGDTPDAFGNATPVYFNTSTAGTFLGDGTFVDNSNVLLSGTVFTIGSGNGSARAVTLAGAAGRVKQYYLQGTTWIVR